MKMPAPCCSVDGNHFEKRILAAACLEEMPGGEGELSTPLAFSLLHHV